MKVVFLGSAGVGKGTYAQEVSKHFQVPTISTGELLRDEVKSKTKLGKEARKYMEKGDLVPSEIVTKLLNKRITKEDCKNGFILDGYPRNLKQAELLEKITEIEKAINFVANKKTILERLGGRRTCMKCKKIYHKKNIPPKKKGLCDMCGSKLKIRKDDRPEAIKKRLRIYKEEVSPVISYYKNKGILKEIDASADINTKEGKKIITKTMEAIKE